MDSTPEPLPGERPKRPRRRFVTLLLGVLLATMIAWGIWSYFAAKRARLAAAEAAARPVPIPVVQTRVARKDVPIFLDGLGTVQAFNSVTIHVRVDGQITKIAFTEGQDVKKGDLLLTIDPYALRALLSQAEARKRQNQAQLDNARIDLRRMYDLYTREVISQQEFDTQVALVAQLEAAVAAEEAAIVNQQVQLGYTTIRSPIDGRVGLRMIDIGNIVHASDPNGIIVVNQLHPISLVFTLPEQHLFEIQQQMKHRQLTVFARNRDNTGPPLSEGTLTVVDNQIDATTGTIRMKATFANDDLRLWPGQFVNARLLLDMRRDGIVVPAAVVQRGPEGTYAFVIKENNTVEVRPVKVAQIQEGEALIDSGLSAGERVVLEGQYRLQPGSAVKIVPPGGAAPAPTPGP